MEADLWRCNTGGFQFLAGEQARLVQIVELAFDTRDVPRKLSGNLADIIPTVGIRKEKTQNLDARLGGE
jgi:hypothetical protein